jgi:hypothetical protein
MSHDLTDTHDQRRIAALIGAIDAPAPASLHASVRELAAAAPARRARALPDWRSRRPALLLGATALACAAVLAFVLALDTGGPTVAQPTVLQASALGLRPATRAAPEEQPGAPDRLAISTEGIAYPYWSRRFGWQTAGVRSDSLAGRRVTTVFYSNPAAQRIGYSIVAGPALPVPAAGRTALWRGVSFHVLRSAGATVVTWRRAGHTCILVGAGVAARTLLTLASWQTT